MQQILKKNNNNENPLEIEISFDNLKLTEIENKKDSNIFDSNIYSFQDEKNFNRFYITINKINDKNNNKTSFINLSLIMTLKKMKFFEKNFSFEELSSGDCFKYEENIEEIFSSMKDLLKEKKFKIKVKKDQENLSIVFNDIFRKKNLISEFDLIPAELKNENLTKNLYNLIEHLNEKNSINNFLLENSKMKNSSAKKFLDFFTSNSTLLNFEDMNFLNENLNFAGKFLLKKLYDSEKCEKNVHAFHNSCDNFLNVLVIIQSNFGKKFGGFCTSGFNSTFKGQKIEGSENDFIFSLSEKELFRKKNKEFAIVNNRSYFPVFGCKELLNIFDSAFCGYDICLDQNCFDEFKNKNSSYLGLSYEDNELKEKFGLGNFDPKSYLPGGEKFWVEKIEVFQVKFE